MNKIDTNNDTLHTESLIIEPFRNEEFYLQNEIRQNYIEDWEEKKESVYKNRIKKQSEKKDKNGVIEKLRIWDNHEISITFDDWYWEKNIKHILDTLREAWVHATFFILWECIKINPELWKQAIDEWHQICCHTYSHIYLNNNSDITDFKSKVNREINVTKRENNVKNLLWDEYFDTIKKQITKSENPPSVKIPSPLLLKTEILMWEAQVKKTLWEEYLQRLKIDHPFFRFPWWNWCTRENNIKILEELWYLSIYWSDDFFREVNGKRAHMTTEEVKNTNIQDGAILLFHFKESDYKYLDAYLQNLKNHNRQSHPLTETINP